MKTKILLPLWVGCLMIAGSMAVNAGSVAAADSIEVINETPTSVTVVKHTDPQQQEAAGAEVQQTIITVAEVQQIEADELPLFGYDWRQKRHSLSISAGAPSISSLLISRGVWVASLGRTMITSSDGRQPRFIGSYAIQYDYQILRWLSIGTYAGYEGWTTSDYFDHGVNVLVRLNFTYLHTPHVRLYSGFGVGAGLHYNVLYNNPNVFYVLPNVNLTPIGVNAGGQHVYGLAEMNFGTAELIRAGIGVRF